VALGATTVSQLYTSATASILLSPYEIDSVNFANIETLEYYNLFTCKMTKVSINWSLFLILLIQFYV
jgi:hypothetical protein